MFEEASLIVKKALDGQLSDQSSASEIQRLVERYDDPSSMDKLSLANQKVEEVKVRLNENINTLVRNQVDLEVS